MLNATNQQRMTERAGLVELSIALHGGPYGSCEECHEAEQLTLKALWLRPRKWQQEIEAWQRHLALD